MSHIKKGSPCLSSALPCPHPRCAKFATIRSSVEALEVHRKAVHDSRSYNVTNRKVEDPYNCDAEVRSSVTCPICGKVFLWKNSMRSHLLAHGEAQFKCPRPNCDKSFKRADQRRWHIRTIHEWEEAGRPIVKCLTCGKEFKTEPLLRFHQKVHRQETAYLCSLCGKMFKVRGALGAHMRSKHEDPDRIKERQDRTKERKRKYKENAKRKKQQQGLTAAMERSGLEQDVLV